MGIPDYNQFNTKQYAQGAIRTVHPGKLTPDYSHVRNGINLDNGWDLAAYNDYYRNSGCGPQPCKQKPSTMETIIAGLFALTGLAALFKGISGLFGGGKKSGGEVVDSESARSARSSSKPGGASGKEGNTSSVSGGGSSARSASSTGGVSEAAGSSSGAGLANTGRTASYTDQLSETSSFKTIEELKKNTAEEKKKITDPKRNLDPISKSGENSKTHISTISEFTDKDGKTIVSTADWADKLRLTEINGKNLVKDMLNIDQDIAKITKFQTEDLEKAYRNISEENGKLGGKIEANNISIQQLGAQISDLEAQISGLKAQGKDFTELDKKKEELDKKKAELVSENGQLSARQTKADAAETAIKALIDQCKATINDLKNDKAKLADIQKFENEVPEKERKLAKDKDSELKTKMKEIDKLEQQIAASDRKNDGNSNTLSDNKKELMAELGALVGDIDTSGNAYSFKNLPAARKYINGTSAGNTAEAINRATKGAGTDEDKLYSSVASINKNNVINILDAWDLKDNGMNKKAGTPNAAKDGMVANILGDANHNEKKELIPPIINALEQRASELGISSDPEFVKAKADIDDQLDDWIINNGPIIKGVETMRNKIKEQEAFLFNLFKDDPTYTFGGVAFREATKPDGTVVYMLNNRVVDQNQYCAEIDKYMSTVDEEEDIEYR
jgi:hypothetical protein